MELFIGSLGTLPEKHMNTKELVQIAHFASIHSSRNIMILSCCADPGTARNCLDGGMIKLEQEACGCKIVLARESERA